MTETEIINTYDNLNIIIHNIFGNNLSIGLSAYWLAINVYDTIGYAYPIKVYSKILNSSSVAELFEFRDAPINNPHHMYFCLKDKYLDQLDKVWALLKLKGFNVNVFCK